MATINKIDILTPMRIHLSKEIKNREESWQEIVFFDFKNNAVFSINGQRMWEYEKEIEEALSGYKNMKIPVQNFNEKVVETQGDINARIKN